MIHKDTGDGEVDVSNFDKLPDDAAVSAATVAKLIDAPLQTLANWRMGRKGPPFFRHRKFVRYRVGDLRAWMRDGRAA